MRRNQHSPLNLFMVIAGVVLIIQLILASVSVRSIGFRNIGTLSREMVLAIILVVIVLSLSLVVLSVLSYLSLLVPNIETSMFHLLPLVAGAMLTILGLASVNLSKYVTDGVSSPIMSVGIELLSIGILSLSLFVQNMGRSRAVKNLPNHFFLIFFLSLLPAAFLIMF
jgi:hypothetical protein